MGIDEQKYGSSCGIDVTQVSGEEPNITWSREFLGSGNRW